MASVPSQMLEEVTAHAQSDNLVDAQEICADGTFRITYVHDTFMPKNFTVTPLHFKTKHN